MKHENPFAALAHFMQERVEGKPPDTVESLREELVAARRVIRTYAQGLDSTAIAEAFLNQFPEQPEKT
jgi:hypothetical protein